MKTFSPSAGNALADEGEEHFQVIFQLALASTAGIKTWAEAAAIFTAKCAICHINSQAGNLSLKTYADALKGGKSGSAIVPGDPDKSLLTTVPQSASHPAMGKLSPEEVAALIAWIEAGAPEK